MTHKQHTEKIIQEFRKEFVQDGDYEHPYFDKGSELLKDLESFLRSALSQVEQEAKQEGRDGLLKELGLTQGWNMKEIKSIQQEAYERGVKEGQARMDNSGRRLFQDGRRDGRSEALAEVREKIISYTKDMQKNSICRGTILQIAKSLASLKEKKDEIQT